MNLIAEERLSDSPLIERIWRSYSEAANPFLSIADSHWGMVVTRHQGKTIMTVRGPETQATYAICIANAEHIGIQFKAGTFMPDLPVQMVMDRHDLNLPDASSHAFWLGDRAWQFPDFENMEIFVSRLQREGLLAQDPLVKAALQGGLNDVTQRTVQRRILRATGLSQATIYQIERARYATTLLTQGVSILDTMDRAGYYDQPHLTRSLARWIGRTPAQIMPQNQLPMSFLYNTKPF